MLCILYVTTAGTLLGIIGLLVERALPAAFPRRWVWCAVIATSVILPGEYRTHHALMFTDSLQQQATHSATDSGLRSMLMSVGQPGWWSRAESYDGMINTLWLASSAVLIVLCLANAWRVFSVVRQSRRTRVDGIPIVATDALGPATVGVWSSRVIVPRWVLALPRTQRGYVLRHEEEHRTSRDSLVLFVASLTVLLMPWNLALWWQLRRLHLAVEMDCDDRVVSALGNPTAYGELLLKVAQFGSRGPRLQPALLGTGMLERRLTMLLAPTPLRHFQRFLLPAAAVALLMIVLCMPHPVLAHGSHIHSSTITRR